MDGVLFLAAYVTVNLYTMLGIRSTAQYLEAQSLIVRPPIEVPYVQGFQWQAERSRQQRKRFFATHTKVGDRWVAR